jgi:hypothetical protein
MATKIHFPTKGRGTEKLSSFFLSFFQIRFYSLVLPIFFSSYSSKLFFLFFFSPDRPVTIPRLRERIQMRQNNRALEQKLSLPEEGELSSESGRCTERQSLRTYQVSSQRGRYVLFIQQAQHSTAQLENLRTHSGRFFSLRCVKDPKEGPGSTHRGLVKRTSFPCCKQKQENCSSATYISTEERKIFICLTPF